MSRNYINAIAFFLFVAILVCIALPRQVSLMVKEDPSPSQPQYVTKHKIADAYNRGALAQSADSAKAAYQQNPDDSSVGVLLAGVWAQQGSVTFQESEYGEKAIGLSTQIIERNPQFADAYRTRGYAFEIREQYDQAIADYTKAIELEPNNADAWNNRGHAYDLQGIESEARANFEKALEIDPSHAHALINMSRLTIRGGDFKAAEDFAQRALEHTSNVELRANSHQLIGNALLRMGKVHEASIAMNEAVKIAPNNASALVGRAFAQMLMLYHEKDPVKGQIAMADMLKDLESATRIHPNQSTAYLLAGTIVKISDKETARRLFEKGVSVIDHDITLTAPHRERMRAAFSEEMSKLEV